VLYQKGNLSHKRDGQCLEDVRHELDLEPAAPLACVSGDCRTV